MSTEVTNAAAEGKTYPTSDPGRWTITFQVQPCARPVPKTVYLVPVIASGGVFYDTQRKEFIALGEVDRTHYWTVTCP